MNLREGFNLGEWTVFPLEGRLLGAKSEQRVQPKSMDVLLYLAENADRVVEREDALRSVWGERAQTDEPLTRCIGELRRALNDTRSEPEYIQTIPKRGYRLVMPVMPLATAESATGPELTEPQRLLRLATMKKIGIGAAVLLIAAVLEVGIERMLSDTDSSGAEQTVADSLAEDSIAVLPFANIGSDSSQEYFSDGISEELLNLLSRYSELRVISRTSAFSYKGRNVDLPTIAAELNVAYILEGSVRRSEDSVRITANLIDARSDANLWSETYDRTLDDIFAIQDEIAGTVVSRLEATLLSNSSSGQNHESGCLRPVSSGASCESPV